MHIERCIFQILFEKTSHQLKYFLFNNKKYYPLFFCVEEVGVIKFVWHE